MLLQPLTRKQREALDSLPTMQAVAETLGEPPEVLTTYDTVFRHWKPGDGRTAVRPETPAEAQAIGRCLVYRTRFDAPGHLVASELHPTTCEWCDYPTEELLKANDYARWRSQYVRLEVAVWTFADGQTYLRDTGRSGAYDNPAWAEFFAMPIEPSARRYAAAMRREAIMRASTSSVDEMR